jgi:transposase, IS5 family
MTWCTWKRGRVSAAGYNIRWLLRAIVRLGLQGLFAPLLALLGTMVTALAAALGVRNAGADRLEWSAG